jgi:hypothetical protein
MSKRIIDYTKWDQEIEEKTSDKKLLYEEIKECDLTRGENIWRFIQVSLLLKDLAVKNGENKTKEEKEMMKNLVLQAYELGKKGIELKEEEDEGKISCHKWFCASIGSVIDYVGYKEKIHLTFEVRKHCDLLVEKRGFDYISHYMSGRWYFEVASLPWVAKKLIETFEWEKMNEAKYEDAMKAFERVNQLKSQCKENLLWWAKVRKFKIFIIPNFDVNSLRIYFEIILSLSLLLSQSLIAQKKYLQAIERIYEAIKYENIDEDDLVAHEELIELEKKLGKQRK